MGKYNPKEEELNYLKGRGLKIGKKVDIFSEYPFDSLYPWLISLGNYVTLSSNVKILAHDASMGYETRLVKIGRVDIGDYVFIGHGTTILCNTKIGNHCIIGAGSVVSGNVPDGSVYAGNPARFICTTEEFRKKHLANSEKKIVINKPWREVMDCTSEEQEKIRRELEEDFGYIKLGNLQ